MKLLAGNMQLAGVGCSQMRAARHFRISCKKLERLNSACHGIAKIVKHPGQRAQVIHGEIGLDGG